MAFQLWNRPLKPCLRIIACKLLPPVAAFRSFRMSARQRSEKVLEQLKESNPYFGKYANKIAAVQKSSPEEFLSRLEKVEKEKNKPKSTGSEQLRDYSELLNPKAPLVNNRSEQEATYKKLSDIMKVDLIEQRSAEEIREIWLKYHVGKEVISAAIPVEQYDLMMERAKKYPIFILPMPRSQGYEFIMLQFFANTVHFTPLINYQVHKENAPECLNVAMYTELREKGLVLMRGEYDPKVISGQEAQCLANQLQLYYSQHSKSKLALLELFTTQPEKFKHMDVIEELNNLKIGE
ncbi:ATP synthase mitochondrial F1 complex assembly factor 1-like [Topomyia yanbarensis]|uniref:ATP synthase mitochondrial F1 complex assembly factor 1-like n=1 Tax=Topomyia yanbarensis TaxID=2498891 RepID=UPI00273CD2B0|nr:ATP synthase mitochondrial F1 complex assembly factor 1-like [Topomyia yanbarensis]XP_058840086.1 ATP synthase mitochondrial F1 complex assembly factor 1-like [Topomyia yanbarensis]